MATIETNAAEAVDIAVEQAVIGRAVPAVRGTPAMVGEGQAVGLGWLRDLPDFRDYTSDHPTIRPRLEAIGLAEPKALTLATQTDLRAYCSPVENQSALGACTAHAVVGLVEYFERRAYGKYIDASRLFVYKATRNLLHWNGDTGAYLRSTIGALALFGVPPEEYWPYDINAFDDEPTAFCYAFANDYRAISYYRLDPTGTAPSAVIGKIKTNISAGLPPVFGFTVYSSIGQAATTGRIPYPTAGDSVIGGHAMLAVGYNDNLTITNTISGSTTKGALIVRNSWGPGWGDGGYGYLPYAYVDNQLAVDWWCLSKQDWTDTGMFKQ